MLGVVVVILFCLFRLVYFVVCALLALVVWV